MKKIPMDELEAGRLYRVDGRNFKLAVYAGSGMFLGVRRKYGSVYIDEELHWDADEKYGTVREMELLTVPVEDRDALMELLILIEKRLSR